MVVVNERQSEAEAICLDSGRFCHIFECSVLLVVQEQNVTVEAKHEIRKAIVVVVARSATDTPTAGIKASLTRDIFELAPPQVVIQSNAALCAILWQKKSILPSLS